MKILKQLNNFVEKHWYYHKEIGDGKAIFYYRSFWNVIVRRKCNQYVVNVGDAQCVGYFSGFGALIETFIVSPLFDKYNIHINFIFACIFALILTSIIYHISTYFNITCNYTNINL